MATPFSYGGFNFTWSNSGRLQYQFGNDKYAVGTLPVPVTQASIDAQKGNGAAENNPAFLQALNNLDVDGLNAAIANAQRPITNEAPASSGDIVSSQQVAKDDGALDQDPILPATQLTLDGRIIPAGTPTAAATATNTTVINGQTIPATEESGTDAPLKNITQTQATPPAGATSFDGQTGIALNGVDPVTGLTLASAQQLASAYGYPSGQLPGVGSGTGIENLARQSDDNPNATNGANRQTTQQVLTQGFAGIIRTQQNQLDQYASYTYALSWYLLAPAQYNALLARQKPDVPNWQLLMQSGGAPATQTVYYENNGQTSAATGGRSQYFPVDFYLDDLEILSTFPLGGTGSAHSAMTLRFKVAEPNGITLIDRLYKAVSSVYKQVQPTSTVDPQTKVNATISSTNPNYPTAQYCMVIRFYGYDAQGNLVAPATGSYSPAGVPAASDPTAVIEKYYPFLISNIKYRMAKGQIEYDVEGRPIGQNYAFGTDRGSIPFNFNLTGQTVGQILVGQPVAAGVNTADPGARQSRSTANYSGSNGVSPAAASVINTVVNSLVSSGSSNAEIAAAGNSGSSEENGI